MTTNGRYRDSLSAENVYLKEGDIRRNKENEREIWIGTRWVKYSSHHCKSCSCFDTQESTI